MKRPSGRSAHLDEDWRSRGARIDSKATQRGASGDGVKRREMVGGLAIVSVSGGGACSPGQAAAQPTPTVEPTATRSPFQLQVTLRPQEARLGQDEDVVIQASFRRDGRPVSGAQLSAIVNYPSGPKTFTSEITTFQDGRLDLSVPVAPAPRGSSVRIEVVMKYQGQEYRQASGFTVR